MVPSKITADIERAQLWEMPKNVLPLLEEKRLFYRNKDKQKITRDLVVMKARNANTMLTRSCVVIGQATVKQSRLVKMERHGRENWNRDMVSERTRGGLRAFRYRSGMRDLRMETKFRRVEKRLPDRYRRRHRLGNKKRPGWVGNKNKYKKG